MYSYPIDYNEFSTEEIEVIVEFMSLVEDANESKKKIDPDVLLLKYNEYRKIINSASYEKQIDAKFEKLTGYSIFKTIRKYK